MKWNAECLYEDTNWDDYWRAVYSDRTHVTMLHKYMWIPRQTQLWFHIMSYSSAFFSTKGAHILVHCIIRPIKSPYKWFCSLYWHLLACPRYIKFVYQLVLLYTKTICLFFVLFIIIYAVNLGSSVSSMYIIFIVVCFC